jgi:hypothetical protein
VHGLKVAEEMENIKKYFGLIGYIFGNSLRCFTGLHA